MEIDEAFKYYRNNLSDKQKRPFCVIHEQRFGPKSHKCYLCV